MRLKHFINEKKATLTGDQHKDYFLKLLNKWDTDLSKLTKAYKSLKSPDRSEFYDSNWKLKKDFMKHPDMKKFLKLKIALWHW